MITWLVGENTFEIREAIQKLAASFDGALERVDGTELSVSGLPDLLMGVSLFTAERLIVISHLSLNAPVWEKLPEWLPRISDDIHIVFVDTKPDKRTTSYKALKTAASMQEFPVWSDRDAQKADQWVSARAVSLGLTLDKKLVQHLVNRVGLDQWQLSHALDMVSLLPEVTLDTINAAIPANLRENIFQLFETALEGKSRDVAGMLAILSIQEDPYALFALLNSQALTLAAVTYAEADANPTKDFAIHPFVASKLTRHGKRLGKARVGRILEAFAKTDADMKRSKAEPWLLVERLLLEVAQ